MIGKRPGRDPRLGLERFLPGQLMFRAGCDATETPAPEIMAIIHESLADCLKALAKAGLEDKIMALIAINIGIEIEADIRPRPSCRSRKQEQGRESAVSQQQ